MCSERYKNAELDFFFRVQKTLFFKIIENSSFDANYAVSYLEEKLRLA